MSDIVATMKDLLEDWQRRERALNGLISARDLFIKKIFDGGGIELCINISEEDGKPPNYLVKWSQDGDHWRDANRICSVDEGVLARLGLKVHGAVFEFIKNEIATIKDEMRILEQRMKQGGQDE